MTGDWNQAGGYLEECVYYAVKYHEMTYHLELGTIVWKIIGETCEIRTVFSTGLLTTLNMTCTSKNKLFSASSVSKMLASGQLILMHMSHMFHDLKMPKQMRNALKPQEMYTITMPHPLYPFVVSILPHMMAPAMILR